MIIEHTAILVSVRHFPSPLVLELLRTLSDDESLRALAGEAWIRGLLTVVGAEGEGDERDV